MASKPILIACAGRTFPEISARLGDFDNWIADGLGEHLPVTTLDIREADTLPAADTLAGVVVTGSHSMVSDREPWSERAADWLRALTGAGVPILGICYGHQLLAHAFGGRVDYHPGGIEIGTADVTLLEQARDDALFGDTAPRFAVQLVHRQSVLALPEAAVLLARGEHEPHQAFRIGACAWGVQFHPEFSTTAMRCYIAQMADVLTGQGRDQAALAAEVRDTPQAAALLSRFAKIAAHAQQ